MRVSVPILYLCRAVYIRQNAFYIGRAQFLARRSFEFISRMKNLLFMNMRNTSGVVSHSPIPDRLPIFVASVLLTVGFSSTIVSFVNTWSESRSHGFVVGGFCIWLMWRSRRRFVVSQEMFVPSVIAAALLSVCWLLAKVTGIRLGYQLVFPFIMVAWIGAIFGRKGLDIMIPISVIFLLAVPFWESLLGILQAMTVAVNSVGLALLGLSATISGDRIHLPFGIIQVAESCAGLSYFMSALTISVIYSHLFLRNVKSRIVAITVALTLAIVSNWLRVFGLVLIGYYTKMTSSLMVEHATYGWIIFAVVISVFFVITGRLEQWDRSQPPRTEAGWLDRMLNSIESEFGSRAVYRSPIVFATLASLLGPITVFAVSTLPSSDKIADAPPGGLPGSVWKQVAPVSTSDSSLESSVRVDKNERWAPDYSGESSHIHQLWIRDGQSIQLDRFFYRNQSQGAELIGGNNRIANSESIISERDVGPLDNSFRIVRETVIRTPDGVWLVWYWYDVAGTRTPSPMRAKLLELVTFFGRLGPSELTAVSAACGPSDCQQALRAVYNFVTGQELPSN